MAVRNQHVRKTKNYVAKEVCGVKYHFYPADWRSDKAKCRYAANRLAAGRVFAPSDADDAYGITIVYVTEGGELLGKVTSA